MKRAARIWSIVWLALLGGAILSLAILFCIAIARGNASDALEGAMAVLGVIVCYSATGALGPVVLRRLHLPLFMTLVMSGHVLAMCCGAVLASMEVGDVPIRDPGVLRIWGALSVITTAGLFQGLLLSSPRQARWTAGCRRVLLLSITVVASSLVAMMWSTMLERYSIVLVALLGIGGISTALSAIVYGVMLHWHRTRRRRVGDSIARSVAVTLCCPGCDTVQRFKTGLDRCASCGLALIVNVEEPRCTCGYLLYRLQGDTCPECGCDVDPALVWKPTA